MIYVALQPRMFAEAIITVLGACGLGDVAIGWPENNQVELLITDTLADLPLEYNTLLITDKPPALEMIQKYRASVVSSGGTLDDFKAATRAALSGGVWLMPTFVIPILQLDNNGNKRIAHEENLTPREIDVLKLLAVGYTNRQTAKTLKISVRTVESHRANIYQKTGVVDRIGLIILAKEKRLIE